MSKSNETEKRIVPMNDQLYDGLFLEELEERLETDPLLPGGLLSLFGDSIQPMDDCDCFAGIRDECSCHAGTLISCPCRGTTRYA